MYRILIILIIALSSITVNAQYTSIKLNLPSFTLNNFSIHGEHTLSHNKSAALSFGYRYPKGFLFGNNDEDGFRFNLNGFIITPEFRFYSGENAPSGFYIAPYIRYMNLGSKWNGIIETDTAVLADYHVKVNFTEFGIGAQGGYQHVTENGFTIDFFLIGPRFSFYNFKARIGGEFNEEAIYDILGIEGLDDNGYYGIGKSLIKWNGNEARVNIPVAFVSFRAGISVGYTF